MFLKNVAVLHFLLSRSNTDSHSSPLPTQPP
jgi:hypothetical protein